MEVSGRALMCSVMQRSVHRTAHLLAVVLLLAASVTSVAPLTAAAVPAMEMTGGSCCPLMAAADCQRAGAIGFSCCDDGSERPGVPLDEAAPGTATTVPVPATTVAAPVPPAPPAALTGSRAAPPLPPRPDLFLLHESFLS